MPDSVPGLTKLNKCPKTIGCDAKSLWQDEQGGLWRFTQMHHTFTKHVCAIPRNEKPEFHYLGEWYNKRTGRSRYIPGTLLRSVQERPPISKTSPAEEWELKKTYIAKLDWQEYKEQ